MEVTAENVYCFLGRRLYQSDTNLYRTTDDRPRDDSRRFGRVWRRRGTADYRCSIGLILVSVTDFSPSKQRQKIASVSR
jgi:hypothetical protein